MSDKKLSDEEIWWLISDFANLSEEEKAAKLIGSGSNKSAYDLGNDWVLKAPHTGSEALSNWYRQSMIKDYIGSKLLAKHMPVEAPILVRDPGYGTFLLQKKLQGATIPDDTNTNLKSSYGEYVRLAEEAKSKNIVPASIDLNPDGIGYDSTGKAKILDVGGPYAKFGETLDNSPRLNALKKASEKLAGSLPSKTKIYRSIPIVGPAIGAGIAAMSGEANAASALPILGEADSLGPAPGSEDAIIENPQQSPDLRRQALQKLMSK